VAVQQLPIRPAVVAGVAGFSDLKGVVTWRDADDWLDG
jgi:hypothetical protein